jgi:hypothetical protein
MKKLFFLLGIIFLAGCQHNGLVYTSGKRLNIGINPQTNESGIQYIDAEQITLVERDNAILTVELASGLDDSGKSTKRVSKIIYEIKEQITQADVDLAKIKK